VRGGFGGRIIRPDRRRNVAARYGGLGDRHVDGRCRRDLPFPSVRIDPADFNRRQCVGAWLCENLRHLGNAAAARRSRPGRSSRRREPNRADRHGHPLVLGMSAAGSSSPAYRPRKSERRPAAGHQEGVGVCAAVACIGPSAPVRSNLWPPRDCALESMRGTIGGYLDEMGVHAEDAGETSLRPMQGSRKGGPRNVLNKRVI
jgi:hypothetical protein